MYLKNSTAEYLNKLINSVKKKFIKNKNATRKSGNSTELRTVKEGETIDMMQMAALVSSNVE